MGVQLGRVFTRGLRRSVSPSGLVVLVLFAVYQFGLLAAMNTVIYRAVPPEYTMGLADVIGFALPVSLRSAVALGVASLVFGTWTFLVATRLLARDVDALSTVPSRVFSRRLLGGFVSAFLVSVLLGILIPIGFVLFVVPGLYLAVSLLFSIFAVGVADDGPIAAMQRSWELATGNRWKLLVVVVILAGVGGVINIASSVIRLVDPLAGQLASVFTTTVLLVVTYGFVAEAFVQLSGETTAV
ncbi:MAG: hypothetical protein ABEJ35_01475 [Halobacteriaceae archaeon]